MTALAEAVVERTMARAIPLSVHVDLTMTCNERCVHCYRVIEDRRELSTDELKALLADLARAGTLYLTFSGGEVFLRADLFALVEHAKRLRDMEVRLARAGRAPREGPRRTPCGQDLRRSAAARHLRGGPRDHPRGR